MRKRNFKRQIQVPARNTEGYAVLHRIESIYEQTKSPVRSEAIEIDKRFNITKLVQRGLLRRVSGGVVPVWANGEFALSQVDPTEHNAKVPKFGNLELFRYEWTFRGDSGDLCGDLQETGSGAD